MAKNRAGSWGVQGGASSTLVEAPQAPDLHISTAAATFIFTSKVST